MQHIAAIPDFCVYNKSFCSLVNESCWICRLIGQPRGFEYDISFSFSFHLIIPFALLY